MRCSQMCQPPAKLVMAVCTKSSSLSSSVTLSSVLVSRLCGLEPLSEPLPAVVSDEYQDERHMTGTFLKLTYV